MTASSPGVAVVGCGYWGKNLVRVFDSLGALRLVCEPSESGIEAARRAAPSVAVVGDLAEVLRNPAISAVVIATPAETHFSIACRAIEAGKHVFVEKPLALTHADGLEMVRRADTAGRVLMVGHILEYHPAVVELAKRIRQGELGTLQYLYSNRLNLGKVRREENILWSFAPHDIAVILRLVGEEPLEVAATGGTYLQPDVADVTVTSLWFARGVRGHVFVSWLHPSKEQRLVVLGSSRMAVFDDVSADRKLVIYDHGIDWVAGEPVPRKREAEVIPLPDQEPLRNEAEHFLHCIRTGQRPLTDGRSALGVLKVLQAAQKSLSERGLPVPLEGEERN